MRDGFEMGVTGSALAMGLAMNLFFVFLCVFITPLEGSGYNLTSEVGISIKKWRERDPFL